ncbi:MAG: hypothetical protein GTO18_16140 [Anaerolineales bacterium]|nr:hypothetical protein [Anaerolineales bacterium]
MNTLVIYFSKFGNTQRVAEAIAEEFESSGSVRTISLDQLKPEELGAADLVVMGTPTHNMNLPKAIQPVLEGLPRRIMRKTPVAAYDTSYKMSPFLARFTAAKKLSRKLRKLGGKRIAPPETFHVEGREGPLYPGEIERAKEWAKWILQRVNGHPTN